MKIDEDAPPSSTRRPPLPAPRPGEAAAPQPTDAAPPLPDAAPPPPEAAPPPPKGGDVGLRALFGAVVIAVVAGLFLAAGPVPLDYASPAPPKLQVDDDGQFAIVLGSTRTTLSRQESRVQAEALLARQRQVP